MGMITFCESRFNYRFQFHKRSQPFIHSHDENAFSRRDALIRVYDAAGDMIETHEHKGDFKEW